MGHLTKITVWPYIYVSVINVHRNFLHLVIKNYGKSLEYGNKHIYECMPRMLTLWLDFGSKLPDSACKLINSWCFVRIFFCNTNQVNFRVSAVECCQEHCVPFCYFKYILLAWYLLSIIYCR